VREGAIVAGFWRRHRVAAAALALSSLFTAGSLAMGIPQVGYDPAGMAINAVVSMAIGFPLLWAFIRLDIRMVAWWRNRHPLPTGPPAVVGAEVPPFRWAGRSTRQSWAMAAFLVITVGFSLLVLYDQPPATAAWNFMLAVTLLFILICTTAMLFALRKRTYVIDASGIHVERGMKSDIHLRWGELREIGIVQLPFSRWFAPLSPGAVPTMIWLRGQDGASVGMVQPAGEVPREITGPLEAALRANAAARGIPVRDVGYREVMTWRRPKRRTLPQRGTP